MTTEERRVAKILSDCQELLMTSGNESEICRQLTLAKHILVTQLLIQEREST
jgi:hypothetical protein